MLWVTSANVTIFKENNFIRLVLKELRASFPFTAHWVFDTNRTENTAPNISSTVACVLPRERVHHAVV
jgi:hypothetical protein